MPFARKNSYRRYNRKRSYNRYKRTFSRYNTYRNRSSVAQANQIYKLNRRITRIESNTKPEYLEYNVDAVGSAIGPGYDINSWSELNLLHITDGTVSSTGVSDHFAARIKDTSARQLKIVVWGALERNPQTSPSGNHDIPFSCCYVRMVVVQYLAEKLADVSGFNFFESGNGPASYYAPLIRGCGTHGKILRVINVKISSLDPTTKNFKFVIRPKQKIVRKTFTGGLPTANQRMKGGIVVVPVGYIEENNERLVSSYHLTLRGKVIYTDA